MRNGLLQRVLRRRWCRALAALAVNLLALQAVGLPLFAERGAESCCCSHRGEAKCGCRACTHAREIESGQPRLQTCAPEGERAVIAGIEPFVFPAAPAANRSRAVAPADVPQKIHPQPPQEVPTPPPLGQG